MKVRRLRARLFAGLGAVAVSALALVALELGLRASGLGAPPPGFESRLKYQRVYLPTFEPGSLADGRAVLHSVDPRLPFQWIAAEKPANTVRVFCFGGSATAGLGFSPRASYPSYLEGLLREAWPERRVEVINLGMVALPSRGVARLVEEACAQYEPDLLVVYSGNNEYLEEHSKAYFRATASWSAKFRKGLESTYLCGLLRGHGSDERPVISTRALAANDRRVNHREMLSKVHLTLEEDERILDAYEANLRSMASSAKAAEVPLLLCTVATNVEWWAMQDRGLDWLREAGPADSSADVAAMAQDLGLLEAALALTDKRLGVIPPSNPRARHEWNYRRAQVLDLLGQRDAATLAYRDALEFDPHRRRETWAHAERVRRVAAAEGVALFDAADVLAESSESGRIGFGGFYDYVHFTPEGAVGFAGSLFERVRALGLLDGLPAYDPAEQVAAEKARLANLTEDDLDIARWTGVNFEPARFAERDLWKYDRARDALDARIQANPKDARALGHRGNAYFFEWNGFEAAKADYEACLALEELPAVRANLERLLGDRRP